MQALDDVSARTPLDEVLARIKKHPLVAVGLGLLAGYLLARALDR